MREKLYNCFFLIFIYSLNYYRLELDIKDAIPNATNSIGNIYTA